MGGSGATDHKTHGSDYITDFESRIGSFSGQQKTNIQKKVSFLLITESLL